MYFPLYVVRAYRDIKVEGRYKIIYTISSRYILDDISLKDEIPNYTKRRLEIIRRGLLPCKIYPLDIRIDSLEALVASKAKLFIDSNGDLVRWNKKAFVPVKTKKVVEAIQKSNGTWSIWLEGLPAPFSIQDYNGERYAQYVRINNIPTLYRLSEEPLKDTRIKI